MTRLSRISSTRDFVVETRREVLRDRRWQRQRSRIYALSFLLLASGLGSRIPPLRGFTGWM
jgi:hypothetical protein